MSDKYTRPRLRIPRSDDVVIEWMEIQDNPSQSIRLLIKSYVAQNGYTDAVDQLIDKMSQTTKVSRPKKTRVEKSRQIQSKARTPVETPVETVTEKPVETPVEIVTEKPATSPVMPKRRVQRSNVPTMKPDTSSVVLEDSNQENQTANAVSDLFSRNRPS